ncbi:GDSL esterase/lipase EXL3-like [Humulus lupulus]|uniref:GDSL esterase/lipase EXL3-like n=1 Tax=Humulus lupulus TaxID=3486 RepID=UPI002B4152AB|nr:GDSL esterase/lipase EXL3-like [Humulus lupulus]
MKFLSPFNSFPTLSNALRVFFFIIITLLYRHNNGVVATKLIALNQTAPALFVFGDSIVDPGNNNFIKTIVKCDFPPYGRDFNGGMPTGRFSNGRIPTDILADEILKIKKLLPAYLDPSLQLEDLLTGVSFASGGSGYDPLTPQVVSVLSLSDQLKMFKDVITKIKGGAGESRAAMILSKSIFIICIGSDDIANTYFTTPFRKPHYDIPAYTDLMAKSASTFLQDLYKEGARRIGVVSLPPIGCVPSQRTLSGDISRGCNEQGNQAATLFNAKLSSLLTSLNNKLPQARLVFFDIYKPLISLIQNPSTYGLEVANKGCCGTGNIEVSILCNPYTKHSCNDPSKYLFWDSYHPSEKGYELLTHLVFDHKMSNFF